jgi:hypothetical protein
MILLRAVQTDRCTREWPIQEPDRRDRARFEATAEPLGKAKILETGHPVSGREPADATPSGINASGQTGRGEIGR